MFEFKLPDLGEGVHEGQVVNVLVKEGEAIAEFQPMLEVETDKAAVEIPAPTGGKVSKIHVEAGQTVKVGEVLISIDEGSASASGPTAPATAEAAHRPPIRAAARSCDAARSGPGCPAPRAPAKAPRPAAERRISPSTPQPSARA